LLNVVSSVDVSDIESEIGLDRYAHDEKGIGGRLKCRYADFRVEEIIRPPANDPKGRFTVAKVHLTNWETHRFVHKIAAACKISRNRIWYSGTKDKRAITTQLMVIDAPTAAVESVSLSDTRIEVIGRTHHKIRLGSHRANRFSVVVRGCAEPNGEPLSVVDALQNVELIRSKLEHNLGPNAVPNWIGPQRFGAGRPVTARSGEYILRGDLESAISEYIGLPGLHDFDESQSFRSAWREQGATQDVLDLAPSRLGYERSMVEALLQRPGEWVYALKKLPYRLLTMMPHAVQSKIFNHWLAKRIDLGWSILEPKVGDVVCALDTEQRADTSRSVVVTERTLDRLCRNARAGRVVLTGPLPGVDVQMAEGEPGDLERSIITDLGLDGVDWSIPSMSRLVTSGSRRATLQAIDEFEFESVNRLPVEEMGERWSDGPASEFSHTHGACLRFRFNLPPGGYATSLLREYMCAPIDHYT